MGMDMPRPLGRGPAIYRVPEGPLTPSERESVREAHARGYGREQLAHLFRVSVAEINEALGEVDCPACAGRSTARSRLLVYLYLAVLAFVAFVTGVH